MFVMNREHYRTPDTEIEAHREQLWQLCREALPSPAEHTLFIRLMNEAGAKGLNWVEGLEFVVERRRAARQGEQPLQAEHTTEPELG